MTETTSGEALPPAGPDSVSDPPPCTIPAIAGASDDPAAAGVVGPPPTSTDAAPSVAPPPPRLAVLLGPPAPHGGSPTTATPSPGPYEALIGTLQSSSAQLPSSSPGAAAPAPSSSASASATSISGADPGGIPAAGSIDTSASAPMQTPVFTVEGSRIASTSALELPESPSSGRGSGSGESKCDRDRSTASMILSQPGLPVPETPRRTSDASSLLSVEGSLANGNELHGSSYSIILSPEPRKPPRAPPVVRDTRRQSLAVIAKSGTASPEMMSFARRPTLKGAGLGLPDPSVARALEPVDESFAGHFRRRFGGIELDKRMAGAGVNLKTIREEYYFYYYYSYTKQWRVMALVALAVALLFIAAGYLNVSSAVEWSAPLWAVVGVMCVTPVVELVLMSFPRLFQRHGLRIHFIALFIYGVFLGSLELFLGSLYVPSYIFLFLLFNYTNSCQPSGPTAFLGCTISLVDWGCLAYAVATQPALHAQCHGNAALSCASRLAGNAVLYVCTNVTGILYTINAWNYTRKTFLNNRELYLKKKHFEDELNKAEYIALSILPKTVWDELKGGQHQRFDMDSIFHKSLMYFYSDVSILFADIAGFTALSGTISAAELVKLLNTIFFDFDLIVGDLGIEKIKTIGDCYMIVAGAPEPVKDHARKAVLAAHRMIKVVNKVRAQYPTLAVRIGIHTGDVYAGLIGHEKFIFDVFSNDVLIASAVEQTGIPNEVHVSETTFQQIKACSAYRTGPPIGIFGKMIPSYFITEIRERDTHLSPHSSSPAAPGTPPSSTITRLNHLQRKLAHKSRSRVASSVVSYLLKDVSRTSFPTVPAAHDGTRGELPSSSGTPSETPTDDEGAGESGQNNTTAAALARHGGNPSASGNGGGSSLGESRRHRSLLRLADNESDSLNKLTCRFNDTYVEQDFQDNYVARCAGKMAFPLAAMCLLAMFFGVLDWIVFANADVGHWWIVLLIHVVMFGALWAFAFVASATFFSSESKPLDDLGRRSGEGSGSNEFLARVARANRKINYQLLGPAALLLLFLSRVVHAAHHTVVVDYLYTQLYPIMMVATLWTRLSSLYLLWTLVAMLAVLVLTLAAASGLPGTDIAWIALYGLAMLLSTYVVIRRMEIYIRRNYILKKHLAQKQFEIDDLRIKSERLLYKLLPRPVVAKLKQRSPGTGPDGSGGNMSEIAEAVDSAGILFCTICHFKEMDRTSMAVLNDIICKFDGMLAKYDIEKIKTIGPIYMCSSGLGRVFEEKDPNAPVDESHVFNLADFALAMRAKMAQLNKDYPKAYALRIGLAAGPLLAGIIGKTKFAYDVWGDTCNVASRMDSTNLEDHIQVTEHLYQLLKGEYLLRERGVIKVKGKGEMRTYFLLGKKGRIKTPTPSRCPSPTPTRAATAPPSAAAGNDGEPREPPGLPPAPEFVKTTAATVPSGVASPPIRKSGLSFPEQDP
ncbi:hypothetical protein H9P43_003454 [Blastocladiella emersonii ATCC 22665]|nr:hypothetical protein H9P43_003454 [Blastocladiella emersonii ATCC 22665]